MTCPNCGGETLGFPVPEAVRDHLPDDRPGAAICRDCLTVTPEDEPPEEYPDFDALLDGFPAGETGAVVASMLALVDSLALYLQDIEALASMAEREGVDVLLLLDRIAASGRIQPHFDIDRRRTQLEQFLR